ncbi:Ff.00g062470.m01.CDS01 [Fusarium sp. VM40]|nr:Ff.00g062470.m01.CDS01 [Fusarium sp. VM40]
MFDALFGDTSPDSEGSDSTSSIIGITKASITLDSGQLANLDLGISNGRNNAWLGSLFTLIPGTQMCEELFKMAGKWRPLSMSVPSAMEYLVAVELLPEEQLNRISVPTSLSGELAIIKGLLLSRKGLHKAAIRVLFENLPMTITTYGQASLEVGIVTAEYANCYNMLRQESIANRISTHFLALRTSQELLNRQDWFFLSLIQIDSLIGTGEYQQADLALQGVMAKPSIPAYIFAMSFLRLSKIRRRTGRSLNSKASPGVASHLRTGIELFAQVPTILQQEILEEVACELANKRYLDRETQQALNTVNTYLSTMVIDTTPSQSRYENTQYSLKQRILHEWDALGTSSKERHQETNVHGQDTFPPTTLSDLSTSNGKGVGRLFMVPHPRHPKFVSRDEVTTITEILTRPERPTTCLVYGEVGIGKSSIATEVVYSCHQNFDAVIWIESGSPSEVNCRLYSIATELCIDGLTDSSDGYVRSRQCMIEWLRHPLTRSETGVRLFKYLIVFDGFGSEHALKPFWPSASTPCSVLVTARNNFSLPRIGRVYINTHELKVRPLSSRQAIQLFNYSMGWWDDEHGESLLPISEDNPLAILKTVESLKRIRFSAWHIENAFKEYLKSYLDCEDVKFQLNHSKSLIVLWFVDFASQKAKDLLDVIAFLQESGTPRTLLLSCTSPSNTSNELVMTVDEFELARDELMEFSLIWKNHETDSLATSSAIGCLIRNQMSPDRFESVYATTLSLLHSVWLCTSDNATHVDDFEMEHSGRCSVLWPQVRELKGRSEAIVAPNVSRNTSIDCIRVLLDITWCATRSRQYEEADEYLTMASIILSRLGAVSLLHSEISKDLQQRYHLAVIDLRCLFFHHQAWLCFKSGKLEMGPEFFNQCLRWLDEGFELRDKGNLQDTGHSLRASVLQGLGMLKLQTKQVQEAVEQYACCLRMMDLSPDYFGQRRLITIHIQKGYAHLMNNQPKEAEGSFTLASDLAKTSNLEDDTLFDTRNFPIKLLSSYGLLKYGLTLAKLNQHAVHKCIEMALEFLNLCSYDDQLKGAIYIIMSCCNARNAHWYLAM